MGIDVITDSAIAKRDSTGDTGWFNGVQFRITGADDEKAKVELAILTPNGEQKYSIARDEAGRLRIKSHTQAAFEPRRGKTQ